MGGRIRKVLSGKRPGPGAHTIADSVDASNLDAWLTATLPAFLGPVGVPKVDKYLCNSLRDSLEPKRTTGIDQWTYLREFRSVLPGARLLDFGCGRGLARKRTERLGYCWHGLDLADSPESKQRESDERVTLYDGLDIPFEDESFDAVLSIQSLEHVEDSSKSISELSRILKRGGCLVGSTSHLEPYHSLSTTNYTPLGFQGLLRRNGMRLERIHPGIDALGLLLRKLFMSLGNKDLAGSTGAWFHDRSPLNAFLLDLASRQKLTTRETNCLRLQFCGTFRFAAFKR